MIQILNFSFLELINTNQNLHNLPVSMEVVRNMVHSAECLQLIRDDFKSAISVNSGFRSPAVNEAVGGAPKSWHQYGLAYDIRSTMSWKFEDLKKSVQKFVDEHSSMVREYIVYDDKKFIHLAFKFN